MASVRKLQQLAAGENHHIPDKEGLTNSPTDFDEVENGMGGMQRTGTVVYSSPDQSVCLYPPEEQKKGKWIDALGHYKVDVNQDSLLPKDLSRADIEQGAHGDCFFITACSIVAQHPELIESLFLSKTWPTDGEPFKFRFWRMDKWQEVHVDSMIPAEKDKNPSYARSPNRRVWPLLLEKAYAAFYGGFDCLEGGNLGETMYAMTGKPVETIRMGSQLQTGSGSTEAKKSNPHIGAETRADFWKSLADGMNGGKKPSILVSVGTSKQLRSKSLQPGHAYAVLDIRHLPTEKSPGAPQIRTVVRLMNPYKSHEYKDAWSKYDKKNFTSGILPVLQKTMPPNEYKIVADGREESNVFWLPVQSAEFMKEFNQINICHLDVNDPDTLTLSGLPKSISTGQAGEHAIRHFPFTISRDQGTAGGNSNWKSWKLNPTFTLENKSGEDVEIWVTIAQPEQRTMDRKRAEKEGGAGGICYEPLAVEYYTLESSGGNKDLNVPTAFRCSSHRRLHRVATYLNQREQSISVTVSKNHTLGYLTVSCHDPGDEASGLLSVAIPKAVCNTCQVHSLKDHSAAYITAASSATISKDEGSGGAQYDPSPPPSWGKVLGKYTASVSPDGRCLEVKGLKETGDHFFRLGFEASALEKWRSCSPREKLEVHVMYEQEVVEKKKGLSDTGGDQYWRMKICSLQDLSEELGGFSAYSNYSERALILDASHLFSQRTGAHAGEDDSEGGLIIHLEYGKSAPKCPKQHLNLKVKIRPDIMTNSVHIVNIPHTELPRRSTPPPAQVHPPADRSRKVAPGASGGPTKSPAPSKGAPSRMGVKKTSTTSSSTTNRPVARPSPAGKISSKPQPKPKKVSMQSSHQTVGGIAGLYGGLE